jgi:hypothetical protein
MLLSVSDCLQRRFQDLRVECGQRCQIQTPHESHNNTTDKMRIQGHIKPLVYLRKPLMSRKSAIARKTPAQTTLPRMTRNQTSQSCRNNQRFKHSRTSFVIQRSEEDLQDRYASSRRPNISEVPNDREEHSYGEKPTRHESDTNGTHDSNRNHLLWTMHLLGEMGGAVETGEGPICVNETDDEGYATLLPAGIVDEGSEYESRMLMCGCDCWNCDENNSEGNQRSPERSLRDCRESLSVAIEEKAEDVRKLVCEEDVPGLDDAVYRLVFDAAICSYR